MESAAARAREEPAALQGQGLRRACAPDVLRGPRGLQHARPDGPHSAAAAGALDRRGFFLLRRCRALRLRATEELRLRLTHHERDSDKYQAVRAMLNDLLNLPHLEAAEAPPLLEAKRLYHRRLIDHLYKKIHGETTV